MARIRSDVSCRVCDRLSLSGLQQEYGFLTDRHGRFVALGKTGHDVAGSDLANDHCIACREGRKYSVSWNGYAAVLVSGFPWALAAKSR
jgi:hypothetical protein